MSQFQAGKNPPWARDPLGQPGVAVVGNLGQAPLGVAGNPGLLAQPGVANPTVYSLSTTPMPAPQPQYTNQQIGLTSLQATMQQAAATLTQLPQPGIAIPTTLASSQVQTVSYPAPRAQVQSGAAPGAKQRVFTGTVTKLHDNFGFVDEDVFFQTSCVKGAVPKVGDRVLVEASYNANMPFKWNATRIQVLPSQQQKPVGNSGPPPHPRDNRMSQAPPPLMSQPVQPQPGVANRAGQINNQMNRRSDGGGRDRDKDRSDRRSPARKRSPTRKRSRSPKRRSRSRTPSRRSSPPRGRDRRTARVVPRYTVQIPKISLDTKEANVIALRSRYMNMYIPSDFFNASFPWTDAFPPHRPFPLGHQCNFQVMHKEVDPIVPNVAVLEPPDADHLYSAKVMLLASPSMEELYHKSCALAEDPSEVKENFQHPTRLVNFLVGLKGKEPMAVGGPWSPSLDGASPNEDPRVLINTAIRTTRALTGIDLSACTQWYRFAEIRYHRPEEMHKGRVVPARVETVLIFLPDVWSCNPSRLEWDGLAVAYRRQLAEKYKQDQADDTQEEEEEEGGGEATEQKPDPTHHSELDPKTMKVNDLRRELEARSLTSKGLKSQLIARLTKSLKTEQEKEETAGETKEEEVEEPAKPEATVEVDEKDEERKKREEEEKKRREERERAVRERRYTLPGTPAILVHPSTTAKSGKFDCTTMSLSVLLDYRPDDNKEHTFEVSLFAELFNEMLMRDFGFEIYKALVKAPEKVKEEKVPTDKKEKDKDKKDKEKKDKDNKEKKDDTRSEESKESKDQAENKKEQGVGEPPAKKKKEEEKESPGKDKKKEERKEDKAHAKDNQKKDKEEEKTKEVEEDDDEEDRKSSVSSRRSREREDREARRKKEREKTCTHEPHLLLAFSYFDQSHTGYLLDKDTEEILHTMGLHLSRSQVKKLVGKVVHKEHVYYRKLTDKAVKEESKEEEGAAMEVEEAGPTPKPDALDNETLAKGNKPLLREFKKESGQESSPGKRSKRSSTEPVNMVMYNGAMLDIPSMIQRLDKSEKLKHETDAKLRDLQEEMDMLKDSCKSSEQNSQKVALELQELKKRLRDQRKATERAETDAKRYHESLASVKTHLVSALDNVRTVTERSSAAAVKAEPADGKKEPEIKKELNGD